MDSRERRDIFYNKFNSLSNWKVIILTGVLFFVLSFTIVTMFPPIHAGEYKEYKIFDDGLTYYEENNPNQSFFSVTEYTVYGIVVDGKNIPCNAQDTDFHGSMLHPQCVEIIMRSLP